MLLYTLTLFVAWDLSRYLLHRLLHGVPFLWELHKVHHSAEVLTPLTLYRSHPIESFLYRMRGVLVVSAVTGTFFYFFQNLIWDFISLVCLELVQEFDIS